MTSAPETMMHAEERAGSAESAAPPPRQRRTHRGQHNATFKHREHTHSIVSAPLCRTYHRRTTIPPRHRILLVVQNAPPPLIQILLVGEVLVSIFFAAFFAARPFRHTEIRTFGSSFLSPNLRLDGPDTRRGPRSCAFG